MSTGAPPLACYTGPHAPLTSKPFPYLATGSHSLFPAQGLCSRNVPPFLLQHCFPSPSEPSHSADQAVVSAPGRTPPFTELPLFGTKLNTCLCSQAYLLTPILLILHHPNYPTPLQHAIELTLPRATRDLLPNPLPLSLGICSPFSLQGSFLIHLKTSYSIFNTPLSRKPSLTPQA